MFGSFLRGRRGVSEIVGSLTMILIAVTLGVALYSYSLGIFSSSGGSFQSSMSIRGERAQERFTVTAVWWAVTGSQMNVTVLNYGEIDLVIDAVYIEGTAVSAYQEEQGETVRTGELNSLKFTSPVSIQSGQVYEITVASERGNTDVANWKA